jgi:O-antigen/teichoic acid export membrane protein
LTTIFLPKASKAIQNKDRASIEKLAYKGTKYTSILVAILCFPVMLSSHELLTLYVGDEYIHLGPWLRLWLFTLTLFLHNSPVSSLVLATGKTKMLIYSSAIACIVSIVINILLTRQFGVGSAVIGYLVYIIIQMSFYYLYFNSNILKVKSSKIFISFFKPTFLGFILFLLLDHLKINTNILFLQIGVKTFVWLGLYFLSLMVFGVFDVRNIRDRIVGMLDSKKN